MGSEQGRGDRNTGTWTLETEMWGQVGVRNIEMFSENIGMGLTPLFRTPLGL